MLGTPLVRVYPVAGAGAAVIVAMSPSRTGVVVAAPVGGVSTARGLTRPPGETGARGAAPPPGDTAARGEALEPVFGVAGVGVTDGRGETLGDGAGVGVGWAPSLGAATDGSAVTIPGAWRATSIAEA
jgi:hypothetical protein